MDGKKLKEVKGVVFMCKCDWCPESKLVDGKMVCSYTSCVLKESEIEKIMQYVLNKERKE